MFLYFIGKVCKNVTLFLYLHQLQWRGGNITRQKGRTCTKHDGCNTKNNFIQQTITMELAYEITSTNQPNVLAVSGFHHFGMEGGNIPLHNANICAFDNGQIPAAKDPEGNLIWPFLWILAEVFVLKDPFVSS